VKEEQINQKEKDYAFKSQVKLNYKHGGNYVEKSDDNVK